MKPLIKAAKTTTSPVDRSVAKFKLLPDVTLPVVEAPELDAPVAVRLGPVLSEIVRVAVPVSTVLLVVLTVKVLSLRTVEAML